MEGWVKLHRKILDNQFLKKDTNAFKVFAYLLLLVDRKTGIWSGGRFQLAEYCGLNPSTIYRVSKRLENAKMVTLTANNKFSTYLISNWQTYQGDANSTSNNQRTTSEQQANTLTRSKELRSKEVLTFEEKNKIIKDRQAKVGYWQGELKSAKDLLKSCSYTGSDGSSYEKRIKVAAAKLEEIDT